MDSPYICNPLNNLGMFWYEEDVKGLEKSIAEHQNHTSNCMAFYGSSSIRLWKTLEDDFKGYEPINLGFGGSTLAACVWFFDRILSKVNPSSIIIYAGDNDLGENRHPEELFIFFKELIVLIRNKFGNIPVGYISVKPSISRWGIIDRIRFTNKIIEQEIKKMDDYVTFINIYDKMLDAKGFPRRDLLNPDGLHLSKKGYALWRDVLKESIQTGKLKIQTYQSVSSVAI